MENYEQQYHTVMHTSKELDSSVLTQKKAKIDNFFQNIGVQTKDLQQTFQENRISIYTAEVQGIIGSNMVNFVGTDSSVIVLDRGFYHDPKNKAVVDTQITHELLHNPSRLWRDKTWFVMGHSEPGYIGIYEATAQMFAEMIENHQLNAEEDYIYFVKSAMKTVSSITHVSTVARQFLNQDRSLEWEIQRLTKNSSWFPTFVDAMQNSYDCSKAVLYQGLDKKTEIDSANKIIIEQLKYLIGVKASEDLSFKKEQIVLPQQLP
jgi:very-short-patch-repair endonuclease